MSSTRVDLYLLRRSEGEHGSMEAWKHRSSDLTCAQSKRRGIWFAAGWGLMWLALALQPQSASRSEDGGWDEDEHKQLPGAGLADQHRPHQAAEAGAGHLGRPGQWAALFPSPVPPSGCCPSAPAAPTATSTLARLWLENPIASFPSLAALTHLEIFTSNRSLRLPPSRRIRPPSTSSA